MFPTLEQLTVFNTSAGLKLRPAGGGTGCDQRTTVPICLQRYELFFIPQAKTRKKMTAPSKKIGCPRSANVINNHPSVVNKFLYLIMCMSARNRNFAPPKKGKKHLKWN